MVTRLYSAWTGTPGHVGSDLPNDWSEAEVALRQRSQDRRERTQYNTTLVARAWDWLLKTFGDDVVHEELSIRFVVELYLDS